MARGDHIFVERELYEHHGIDLGGGWVAHWVKHEGMRAEIRKTRMRVFLRGGVKVVRSYPSHDPDATIARVEEQIGRQNYDLLADNCEHFATYCITGRARSGQVRGALVFAVGCLVVAHFARLAA